MTCKVNIETKREPRTVLGVSKVAYMNDASWHKRGRTSNYSNERTYGSNVRYLPGSKVDANDIYIHNPSIKISKLIISYLTVNPNKESKMKRILDIEDQPGKLIV